jgi:hypothetical protein
MCAAVLRARAAASAASTSQGEALHAPPRISRVLLLKLSFS